MMKFLSGRHDDNILFNTHDFSFVAYVRGLSLMGNQLKGLVGPQLEVLARVHPNAMQTREEFPLW